MTQKIFVFNDIFTPYILRLSYMLAIATCSVMTVCMFRRPHCFLVLIGELYIKETTTESVSHYLPPPSTTMFSVRSGEQDDKNITVAVDKV